MKNRNKQTKFPVARIKRIMQKDEEVGKVAQATPVVISKALEMFLAMLVEESNQVTASRGSKKVEAYHLKHAVETVEMLDFLKEIVEPIPDPSAGGTIDLDSEEACANAENAPKKKRNVNKGKAAATANVAKPAKTVAEGAGKAPPKKRRRKKTDIDPMDAQETGDGAAQGVVAGGATDSDTKEDRWHEDEDWR